MFYHSTLSIPIHPNLNPSISMSAAVVSTKLLFSGDDSMSSSKSSPWFLTGEIYFSWLEALKTPSLIGSPGEMVGRSNFRYLIEEGQDLCQQYLQMDPPPGCLQTSWHNGRSPQKCNQKTIKSLRMKVRGVSLGIDVTHGDCSIAVLVACSGNIHWTI